MSRIRIEQLGITKAGTECIVNAANEQLQAGGGVCGVIFQAAGHKQLQKACDDIGYCNTGSAVITPAFHLNAKYIIHAVGPVWYGGKKKEPQKLYGCYKASLNLAKEYGCHSIAFPLISAGIFGYPKEQAWRKALQACSDFIHDNPDYDMDILFTIRDPQILQMGLAELKSQTKNADVQQEKKAVDETTDDDLLRENRYEFIASDGVHYIMKNHFLRPCIYRIDETQKTIIYKMPIFDYIVKLIMIACFLSFIIIIPIVILKSRGAIKL